MITERLTDIKRKRFFRHNIVCIAIGQCLYPKEKEKYCITFQAKMILARQNKNNFVIITQHIQANSKSHSNGRKYNFLHIFPDGSHRAYSFFFFRRFYAQRMFTATTTECHMKFDDISDDISDFTFSNTE